MANRHEAHLVNVLIDGDVHGVHPVQLSELAFLGEDGFGAESGNEDGIVQFMQQVEGSLI